MNKRRATIVDIAERAGVSPSTVDRVLNSRLPVKGKTADRVLAAARELRYHGINLLAQRVDENRRSVTLGLLLQSRSNPFFRELCEHIHDYAKHDRPECRNIVIEEFKDKTPKAMAASLHELAAKVDVLGVMAFDHPTVNEAVAALTASGKQVVAVLSGLSAPSLAGYVGIDHQKAGRTAGWSLAKLLNRTGKVGMLIESYQYRAFQEREFGLRNYILEHEPEMEVCEGIYGIASNQVVERMFEELLARHPDLKALYFVGAGVAAVLGMVELLPLERRPLIVCHELTPVTRSALLSGSVAVVLDTPRRDLAREIVDQLLDRSLELSSDHRASHVEFRFYCPENI
ncbi:LacI family DNA-binding transcriptional regulator [Rhizobium leguminosarum]|uniref:LacI family DNA-binding transcriptional regulator n=1 Tax=Rhizobium leguminosarum TaxID=384 RepID=UPI001C989DD0|nr:LacI family DNA-binding transcriptional regulator [Rhizobium leguminosarum]MBY5406433.1 substrate-binding domain-containing protein [Rhizobium leguminosarum]